MAGVAAAVVGGLALAGGAAARGLGETQSWMGAIVDEAKANVRSPPAPAAPLRSREAAATLPPSRPITPDATHESAKRSWDISPSSPGAGGLPAAVSGAGGGGDFPVVASCPLSPLALLGAVLRRLQGPGSDTARADSPSL